MMILRIVCFLAATLALAGPAHAEWHEAKSKHFIIYSDGSPQELREFATKVEKVDRAVRIVRKMEDPPLGERRTGSAYRAPQPKNPRRRPQQTQVEK